MNPDTNPYAPGAGMPLPELAGRDEGLEQARVAVRPAKSPKVSARSFIYVRLRGVGKATFSRCSRQNAVLTAVIIRILRRRSISRSA